LDPGAIVTVADVLGATPPVAPKIVPVVIVTGESDDVPVRVSVPSKPVIPPVPNP
jgi:hypothetical protein